MTAAATAERRALLLVFAGFGAFWGAWAALVPALQQQTGLDDGQLGLCFAAIAGAALPAMRLSGRLVDRYGAARLMPAALLLFAVAVPLPALAHGALVLSLGCVVLGIATGVLDVVANVATAAWERLEADRLMALCHATFSAGLLVGSVVTGLSRDAGAGPVMVLSAVAAVLVVLALRQPHYRRAAGDEPPAEGRGLPRVLLLIGLLVAAAFLVEDAVQSWSALRLERGLGAAPWLSGLGPGLFAAAMTAGRLGTHLLGARFTEVRLVMGGWRSDRRRLAAARSRDRAVGRASRDPRRGVRRECSCADLVLGCRATQQAGPTGCGLGSGVSAGLRRLSGRPTTGRSGQRCVVPPVRAGAARCARAGSDGSCAECHARNAPALERRRDHSGIMRA